jgi:hypothetical protein
MQILEDFLKWILKINLIDISIIIFILINAGLIIFFIIKGIKAIKKIYKKDSLKKIEGLSCFGVTKRKKK